MNLLTEDHEGTAQLADDFNPRSFPGNDQNCVIFVINGKTSICARETTYKGISPNSVWNIPYYTSYLQSFLTTPSRESI
jgi:hypothetical protein